ncbi:UNVERIFIED_CONTAM: hypothetical protein NCL1_13152 [Trichonephila clavipes]
MECYCHRNMNQRPWPLRVLTDAVLGELRAHRPGQLRTDGHSDLYPLLGSAHVRILLRHQRGGAAQPAHRHDEPLLPDDLVYV